MPATSKSENSEIAVLQTQMEEVKDSLQELKEDIKAVRDALDNKFVTKAEFDAFKQARWLAHVSVALVTAAITGLVTYFITHVGK